MDFQNFQKSNFVRSKYLKFDHLKTFPGAREVPHKFGPGRFSRLLDTNKQTDTQTDKQSIFIDIFFINLVYFTIKNVYVRDCLL